MGDELSLLDWRIRFENWVEFAKPMFTEGKAKEAFAKYPWFSTEGDPFIKPAKPASEMRFGLITTGGYSIEGKQEPMRGYPTLADEVPQIRRIPLDVDRSKLKINHPGYDHKYAEEDINCNLPFDRLQEMVKDGTIGSLSNETMVLMGLLPNVEPLIEKTIPQIIAAFKADDVEVALLVPSWPACHQTVSLIARGLEYAGIASVLVSVMPALSGIARPPRQVIRRLNIGATVGRPHDVQGQRSTLAKMVKLIDEATSFGAEDKDKKKG